MHGLLETRDWSGVTMSDVAKAAGLSRQTLYSTFGNRQGLAQAYALQLSERYAGEIRDSINRNPGQVETALHEGINGFLLASSRDPSFAPCSPATSSPTCCGSSPPRPGR
ncbi:TetR/AcrR family transcriptional regulator [Dietzia aerolata]|uniref:TetR/AcrR family transcriptional regulator n=1 Tax=Dietzia aerolata TaxID=595984 RepID=UPI003629C097